MRCAASSSDNGLFLAAGVSFYFLVCLVPMLFLFVSAMGYLLTSEAATAAALSQISQLVPVYRKELAETLSQMIATRKTSGVIGTVILLFFSTQLFACLRMVMNVIFEERRGRGFFRGMLWDVVMLVIIGVLFVMSMLITDLLFWLRTFILTPAHMPRQWVRYTFIALAVGFNTGLYFVVYRYFPTRRIHVGRRAGGRPPCEPPLGGGQADLPVVHPVPRGLRPDLRRAGLPRRADHVRLLFGHRDGPRRGIRGRRRGPLAQGPHPVAADWQGAAGGEPSGNECGSVWRPSADTGA